MDKVKFSRKTHICVFQKLRVIKRQVMFLQGAPKECPFVTVWFLFIYNKSISGGKFSFINPSLLFITKIERYVYGYCSKANYYENFHLMTSLTKLWHESEKTLVEWFLTSSSMNGTHGLTMDFKAFSFTQALRSQLPVHKST